MYTKGVIDMKFLLKPKAGTNMSGCSIDICLSDLMSVSCDIDFCIRDLFSWASEKLLSYLQKKDNSYVKKFFSRLD